MRLGLRARGARRATATRTAIAACHRLLAGWRWPHPSSDPATALHAAEAQLVCPCPTHAEAARDVADALDSSITAAEGDPDLGLLLHHTTDSRAACALVGAARLATVSLFAAEARRDAVKIVTGCDRVMDDPDALREAISAELVAWALGPADPVLARVNSRRGRQFTGAQ